MKRHRSKSPLRLTRDAEKLITLSTGLLASGSRAEDRFWENQISALAGKLVTSGNDAALEAALDHTFQSNSAAYDVLMELVEGATESGTLERDGAQWDVLLIAIPLVAWTKYALPSGPIAREALDAIVPHLHGHVLAREARCAMSPYLYSIDQIPREMSGLHKLMVKLGNAAIDGGDPRIDFSRYPETAPMLADARFLLAAVATPAGHP
ncbi:MAG TPA: DUF2863 family protein, partial [Usitatibacteraceae bacterium]|nr:DUF2863 family protein [Usitatibacteraceae bacterium]